MTTLIERYLHAVRSFLPASKQEDIIQELSDDIGSQAADREAELGRPLTEGEVEELLKQFGHPLLLAARYRPQRQLISSAIFPFYWFALEVSLGVALVVHVAIGIAMAVGGGSAAQILGPIAAFPFGPAVTVFGWVTLLFALVDLNLEHVAGLTTGSWNPRSLPEPHPGSTHSSLSLLFEIVASTVFLGWWLAVPHYPFLILGPAAAFLSLAPVWQTLYVPVALAWLASLAALWIVLLWPEKPGLLLVARVLTNGLGLIMAIVLLNAGALVVANPGADGQAANLVRGINLAGRLGVLTWALGCVFELMRELWKAVRSMSA